MGINVESTFKLIFCMLLIHSDVYRCIIDMVMVRLTD
jgi:hypothetical protein